MEHCRFGRLPKGPSYTFDDKSGKWQHSEIQHPAGSWRERSRGRSYAKKTRVAQPKCEIQERRLEEQAGRPCSESFTASGEEDTGMASHSVLEQPLMTPLESVVSPPASLEPAAPPIPQERGRPCLICGVHLTGARLTEMEDIVEQMTRDHSPLQDGKVQHALHRLPYRNVWPDNFYINAQHHLQQ